LTAAAYSRAFSFCGSDGVDLMEPLSFKGRRGSGLPGGRCGYADKSLNPRWDWQKFIPTYQVWGRLMYDPSDVEGATRGLARADAASLASASRILPIITTAHLPSAANNTFWPEMYTNQPIVDPARKNPYTDTPSPKVFGNTSPLDPQLFLSVNAFADELLKGERSGKYTPIEVAQWLEDLAKDAVSRNFTSDRRLGVDVMIQASTGNFFAAKLRAGVLYRIHERTGDRAALEEAIKFYKQARSAWVAMTATAKPVYVADLTVGEHPWLRGNWGDRLDAIDADIAEMTAKLAASKAADVGTSIRAATGKPLRPAGTCRHTPPAKFRPSQAVELAVETSAQSVRLWYRRVTQAERWLSTEMQRQDGRYSGSIPSAYTDSPYPLQYYFELRTRPDQAWLYPGFGPDLAQQPYFVIRHGG
jgi:hypothetical protein